METTHCTLIIGSNSPNYRQIPIDLSADELFNLIKKSSEQDAKDFINNVFKSASTDLKGKTPIVDFLLSKEGKNLHKRIRIALAYIWDSSDIINYIEDVTHNKFTRIQGVNSASYEHFEHARLKYLERKSKSS